MLNMFFGDSHSRQFVGTSYGIFCHYVFSGATIKGLANHQSVTGHASIIRQAVRTELPKTLFFMFGSVDLDFSFVRSHCLGVVDRDGFIQERVDIYCDFLSSVRNATDAVKDILVTAPQLSPLVGDNFFVQTAKHILIDAERIREIARTAPLSDAERALTVLDFNDRLEAALRDRLGIRMLRIDRTMWEASTARISDSFIPGDPNEHHARVDRTQWLWRSIMNPHITDHAIVG